MNIRSEYNTQRVPVTMMDRGGGFSPEVRKSFNFLSTTKSSGMGMALSTSIIDAHGGRIWAEPNVPRGATVQFTSPSHQTVSPS